jgi:hypothetical protein
MKEGNAMRKRWFWVGLVPGLVLGLVPGLLGSGQGWAQGAGDFSEKVVITAGNSVRQGKLYVSHGMARVDTTDAKGRQNVMIINKESNLVYMIVPSSKTIMEHALGPEDGFLIGTRPKDVPSQKVASESVNGQPCDKFSVASGKHQLYVWVRQGTEIPMKMSSDDSRFMASYSDLSMGPQAADLFALPAGYRHVQLRGGEH